MFIFISPKWYIKKHSVDDNWIHINTHTKHIDTHNVQILNYSSRCQLILAHWTGFETVSTTFRARELRFILKFTRIYLWIVISFTHSLFCFNSFRNEIQIEFLCSCKNSFSTVSMAANLSHCTKNWLRFVFSCVGYFIIDSARNAWGQTIIVFLNRNERSRRFTASEWVKRILVTIGGWMRIHFEANELTIGFCKSSCCCFFFSFVYKRQCVFVSLFSFHKNFRTMHSYSMCLLLFLFHSTQ